MDNKTTIYLTNSSDTDGTVAELNRLGYSAHIFRYTVRTNASREMAYQVFYSIRSGTCKVDATIENFN